MPVGEALLLAFFALVILAVLIWRVIVWDTKRKALRRQGRANAEDARTSAEHVCSICHKNVDPLVDVYEDAWKHVKCFAERLREKMPAPEVK